MAVQHHGTLSDCQEAQPCVPMNQRTFRWVQASLFSFHSIPCVAQLRKAHHHFHVSLITLWLDDLCQLILRNGNSSWCVDDPDGSPLIGRSSGESGSDWFRFNLCDNLWWSSVNRIPKGREGRIIILCERLSTMIAKYIISLLHYLFFIPVKLGLKSAIVRISD